MLKPHIKFAHVDTFTRSPFRGRPVAVTVLPYVLPEPQMQIAASELGLAEMVFLLREGEGFALRSFSPEGEVVDGESAALAGAHCLWAEGHLPHLSPAVFFTRNGRLEASKRADHLTLDVPEARFQAVADGSLAFTRNLGASFVGRDGDLVMIELGSERLVRDLDAKKLDAELPLGLRLVVTAPGKMGDYVTRVVARSPIGMIEEPISGAVHIRLGVYWLDRLKIALAQGEHITPRVGVAHVERSTVAGRLLLSCQAVTVVKGVFMVMP